MSKKNNFHPTRYWQQMENGRVQCNVCPRGCQLNEGQRGLCFVRMRHQNQVVLTSYGRSSGFCIDPIEKKPLNHFYPGSSVLSFGTAGCNLTCRFCQNWDISKSKEFDKLQAEAGPEAIARVAEELGCKSVAFTYNDPTIFMEYAMDTAVSCHQRGLKTVAVTAAYMCQEPRRDFYQHMDAANVDLKAFNEDFYRKICGAELGAVLESLEYIKHETNTWLEITTLLIPGHNDSIEEIEKLSLWVYEKLGADVPLHFSAFHPDWKMREVPATPAETLFRARDISLKNGLRYVYTGNIDDETGGSTYCVQCGARVIGRNWYDITEWGLKEDGACKHCGAICPGVFEASPGTWGNRRSSVPVHYFSG